MEVAVPHIQEPQAHRQVGLDGAASKVFVHGMCACQKLTKTLGANGNRQRQADGRPHGIPSAHPIPKPKRGLYTKGLGCGHVGGERGKVVGCIGLPLLHKPPLGRLRVGHGFYCCEGFAGDQKQGFFRVQLGQGRGKFMAIDIAHKVQPFACCGKCIERQHRHVRTEIRAADSNVDNVGDACISTNLLGK